METFTIDRPNPVRVSDLFRRFDRVASEIEPANLKKKLENGLLFAQGGRFREIDAEVTCKGKKHPLKITFGEARIDVEVPAALLKIALKAEEKAAAEEAARAAEADANEPKIAKFENDCPAAFELAFQDDWKVEVGNSVMNFENIRLGDFNTGCAQLIASGPKTYNDQPPFAYNFPVGSADVELAIADLLTEQRVAYARLKFSSAKPIRWEYARVEKERVPTDTKLGKGFVYGGTCCFISTKLAMLLGKDNTLRKKIDASQKEFMNDTMTETWGWALTEHEGESYVMFSNGSSGEGDSYNPDGAFRSYVGYDGDGQICRLLTDFEVLPFEDSQTIKS
tara:strand:+ start:469 stop:1479 length:1011 start_codon:yes stop_codon:yes gene_type:complete